MGATRAHTTPKNPSWVGEGMAANDSVLNDILEQIKTKESEGGNGDIGWMQLILIKAVYRKMENVEDNPMIKFGNLIKSSPRIAWLSLIGVWIAIAFSVAVFLTGLFNTLGLAIIAMP